jgi:thiosulfate/3-mercaptopyruvate sulfurtransferase
MNRIRHCAAATFALWSCAALAGAPDGPLVSTGWLAAHLDDPNVRVVEVSVDPGVYGQGHIPGAQNVVWHTDLVDTVRRDIASRERFQDLVRRLGLEEGWTTVL